MRRGGNDEGGTSGVSRKQGEPMTLHVSQAHLLKRQPDTPLGRRDALLVCLFLDQGFRCGEVHTLHVKRIDLEAGMVAVPGEKGNSTHHLTHGMRNEI